MARRPRPASLSHTLGVVAATAAAGLAGCGSGAPIDHYLPGVVDDALAGALTYGPLAPPGPYRVAGGPGGDGRGCRTISSPAAPALPGIPGTRFSCQEDFDAPGTTDHVVARYRVVVGTLDCWYAHLTSVGFVTADGLGRPADLTAVPRRLYGCGLASVEGE